MKTEQYTKKSIAEFVKFLYPLAHPVIELERSAGNKYKCIVYMHSVSVPAYPLYSSNYCNNKKLALSQILLILQSLLEQQAMEISARAISMKRFAQAEVRKQELIIQESDSNINAINNTLLRLRRLMEKNNG